MVSRLMSVLLFLTGLTVLARTGYDYFVPRVEPVLTVDQPDRVLPNDVRGKSIQLDFLLTNPSRVPIRVIGNDEGTSKENCRIVVLNSVPFEIGPGSSVGLKCELRPLNSQQFENAFVVYYDGDGLRELALTVRSAAKVQEKEK
jgi:hypothetical protein